MTEKELGEALLHLDTTATPDVKALTARILQRDRRRGRLLIWMSAGRWVMAAVLVLFILVMFGLLFPLQAKLQQEVKQPTGRLTPAQIEQHLEQAAIAFQMGSLFITLALGALVLAALCTTLLVLASRRATLRQVN